MAIQSVRGMPDILPEQAGAWRYLEQTAQRIFNAYGLTQIRTPIVEDTALFARSIGDVTDIVEKEMYTFDDRSGDSLTLRPELTAGVVRAAIEHGLLHNQTQRLWYQGPAFRYERPQKGRYRQFHQIGVECFGIADARMDVDLLEMTDQLWTTLGIRSAVTLEINSIGSPEARSAYRSALVDFLASVRDQLDPDSQARLERSPLRILDSKNASTQALLADAPSLIDYLTDDDRQHFELFKEGLSEAKIDFVINPRLVRGLDYYGRTVFEWTTTLLGAQSTVCGGGRYDGLVALFGGKQTPAAGFAVGLERLILLMQALDINVAHPVDLYVITADTAALAHALPRIDALRSEFPELEIAQHLGGGSFKSQFKRADKSGASVALIYGEAELAANTVTLKPLRGDDEQRTIADAALASFLSEYLIKVDSA